MPTQATPMPVMPSPMMAMPSPMMRVQRLKLMAALNRAKMAATPPITPGMTNSTLERSRPRAAGATAEMVAIAGTGMVAAVIAPRTMKISRSEAIGAVGVGVEIKKKLRPQRPNRYALKAF